MLEIKTFPFRFWSHSKLPGDKSHEHGSQVFHQLQKNGMEPTLQIYELLVRSFSRAFRWRKCLEVVTFFCGNASIRVVIETETNDGQPLYSRSSAG